MKSLYKTVKILSLAVLTLSLSNCTDELTTNSSTAISEETILSSTNQLNMVLNSVYKYILMGDMDQEVRMMLVMPVYLVIACITT